MHADGLAFLGRRGFVEFERIEVGPPRPRGASRRHAVEPPPGVVLTTLAERPDLATAPPRRRRRGVRGHPGRGRADQRGIASRSSWPARSTAPTSRPTAFAIALDEASGEVVGYAALMFAPGQHDRVAWHDMTAVRRAWRGRGIATALKRRDHRVGDRPRPRGPRDRQRRGQRADAGGEPAAGLPADAGPGRPARAARAGVLIRGATPALGKPVRRPRGPTDRARAIREPLTGLVRQLERSG